MLSGDPPSSGPGYRRGSIGVFLAGPLPFSEALALHDELVGVVGKSVEGALGEDRVAEERDPLVDGAVARDDGRATPVAFEDDLVEVTRLLGREASQAEVIEDQEIRCQQAPEGLLRRVIRSRLVQPVVVCQNSADWNSPRNR